jgi:hypothetical protein
MGILGQIGNMVSGAIIKVAAPGKIAYMNHGRWYSLRLENGSLVEKKERVRPTEVDCRIVRGGRDLALAVARHEYEVKDLTPMIDEADDELEDERAPKWISERRFKPLQDSRFPRISGPSGFGRHGLGT